MFEKFKTRAEAVSAEVHRLSAKALAVQFVFDFLAREGVSDAPGKYAAWADCPFLSAAEKETILAKVPGCKFGVTKEIAASARVGLSQMNWAVSDTGTLVQDATAVDNRLVSSLPEVHVALVDSANILPDLGTLLNRVTPKIAPYIAFITGPSRTADIERVLTIGAHGPRRLIVLVVDDLGASA